MNGISSLVDDYLNSPPPAASAPRAPAQTSSAPPASQPYVTESSVKSKLKRGVLVYEASEVRLIRSLLEQVEGDPFSGNSFLTPSDLKSLDLHTVDAGTEVVNGDGDDKGLEGVFDATPKDAQEPMEKMPITASLCAPDNTVGSSEPIPPEILSTLEVLKSGDQEKPYNIGGATAKPVQEQPQASQPVKGAFEDNGIEQVPTNNILTAFESAPKTTQPDSSRYLAEAQAMISGGATASAGADLTEAEAAGAQGALNIVKAFRRSKPQSKPVQRRSSSASLEGISEESARRFSGAMSALGGAADDL